MTVNDQEVFSEKDGPGHRESRKEGAPATYTSSFINSFALGALIDGVRVVLHCHTRCPLHLSAVRKAGKYTLTVNDLLLLAT